MSGILTTHLHASNQKGIKFFCDFRGPNIQVNKTCGGECSQEPFQNPAITIRLHNCSWAVN